MKQLKDKEYEAIFIPKGAEPPARDTIEKPELRVYTDDFGTRKGDNCLVADSAGRLSGRSGRESRMIMAMWMRMQKNIYYGV